MHKFTEVASREEKNKFHVTHDTSCLNYKAMKCNLHAEHKQMHKFTEVASGEREIKYNTFHTLCQND